MQWNQDAGWYDQPFYEIIAALHTDEVEGLAPTSGSTAAPIGSQ